MMCNASQAATGCLNVSVLAEPNFGLNLSEISTQSFWQGSVNNVAATRAPEVENLINFILWVIWALTVFGNILVLSVIIRDKELLYKPANIFILNLSASDLLVGLVSMTFQNIWRIKGEWVFGEFVCKSWTTLDFSSTTQSAFAIALISFDRFMLVSTGLKYKQYITLPKTVILIIFTWCCSLIFNATPVLLSDNLFVRWVSYEIECDFAVMYNHGYQLSMFLLSFAFPIILVAFFNLTVYNNIRQRAKRFQSSRMGTANSSTRGSQGRSTTDYRKHRKAAVTLALIVGVFLVCWVPYWINKLVIMITMDRPEPATESDALAYLLWSNSAVNPFLYAVTNPRIRSGMLHILRKPLPKRFATQARRQRTTEYNMGETNMTKITSRQEGE